MTPNITLITVDQMRRDCLGVMGHDVIETPNLGDKVSIEFETRERR